MKNLVYSLRFTVYGLLIAILIFLSLFSFSQDVKVTAELDTNAILIGQHAKIKLQAEYKTDQGEIKIDFPKIADPPRRGTTRPQRFDWRMRGTSPSA